MPEKKKKSFGKSVDFWRFSAKNALFANPTSRFVFCLFKKPNTVFTFLKVLYFFAITKDTKFSFHVNKIKNPIRINPLRLCNPKKYCSYDTRAQILSPT